MESPFCEQASMKSEKHDPLKTMSTEALASWISKSKVMSEKHFRLIHHTTKLSLIIYKPIEQYFIGFEHLII